MSSSPTDITMPQMGVSVTEGTVVAWHKRVGEAVTRDEAVCEVSTDKIDTECPSPAAGRLAEILVEVGTTVPVGTVLARLAAANGDGAAVAAVAAPTAAPAPAAGFSPVVTRMAAEHGLDLSQVTGSGRNGRVTKKDVLAHLEQAANEAPEAPMHIESPYRPEPGPEPEPAAGEPLSRMRVAIGQAMRRSLETAATCTTIVECDMAVVERRRRELGVTALPLVAHALVATLREFPTLNATLEATTLTRHAAVHLGIAVSLGEDGLVVPVLRDAQHLSVEGIAAGAKVLAARAREGTLGADDVRGATFTLTNPGAFGALAATPIINVPQVGILDLEAIVKRPVVVADADGQDAIAIRPMANLCLSWDHRALDGAYAARFLTALRRRLEAPAAT